IDVAFIALHGRYGEDGAIQGLLEVMQIPYTGSGVLSSALCMDKILTKRLVQDRGFFPPPFRFLDLHQSTAKEFVRTSSFNYPVVVKPSREGSTIGITIVKETVALETTTLG